MSLGDFGAQPFGPCLFGLNPALRIVCVDFLRDARCVPYRSQTALAAMRMKPQRALFKPIDVFIAEWRGSFYRGVVDRITEVKRSTKLSHPKADPDRVVCIVAGSSTRRVSDAQITGASKIKLGDIGDVAENFRLDNYSSKKVDFQKSLASIAMRAELQIAQYVCNLQDS